MFKYVGSIVYVTKNIEIKILLIKYHKYNGRLANKGSLNCQVY